MASSALITVMVGAARKAARNLVRDFNEVENLQVSRKGPADFVSAADRRAEEILQEELERVRPGYQFLLEESGEIKGTDTSHRWIIDPLDGTTNFLHGIPLFSISIGLEREGELVAGVIYNPATDELFSGEKGKGAYLNNRRLRVAARSKLAESVICCGVPHLGRGDHKLFITELEKIMSHSAGVRRTGSSALDLAWVAAGRFDAYWERGLSPWDMAAGILIARESGAIISDLSGGANMMECGEIVAGNEALHIQILKLLKP